MSTEQPTDPVTTFRMLVRVGYYETDGQRRVHHANYLNYFEQSRVEMLRSVGFDYREFENTGLMLVVTEMNVRYRGAAEFDDLLRISTTVTQVRGVRIRHRYEIDRDGELLVEADSTIACVDRTGKVRRLPPQWGVMFAPSAPRGAG
jgi:acyl-CoA thioester hydrolase